MNQAVAHHIEVRIPEEQEGEEVYGSRFSTVEYGSTTIFVRAQAFKEPELWFYVTPDSKCKLELLDIKLTMLCKIYDSKGDLIFTDTEPRLMDIKLGVFRMTLPYQSDLVHLTVSSIGASDDVTQTALKIMFGALDDE